MDFSISTNWMIALIILVAWEVFWKSLALWRAAKNDHPIWFGALLLINTAGVFPMLYLLFSHSEEARLKQVATH